MFSKNKKKKLRISGSPLQPITVGCRAVIDEIEDIRTTSTVERIIRENEKEIVFETQNTLYELAFISKKSHVA